MRLPSLMGRVGFSVHERLRIVKLPSHVSSPVFYIRIKQDQIQSEKPVLTTRVTCGTVAFRQLRCLRKLLIKGTSTRPPCESKTTECCYVIQGSRTEFQTSAFHENINTHTHREWPPSAQFSFDRISLYFGNPYGQFNFLWGAWRFREIVVFFSPQE